MFRKFIVAGAAALAISAAALPTAASAHHWHSHFWGGPAYYPIYSGYGGGCYAIRKFVPTPFGLVKKKVIVCD